MNLLMIPARLQYLDVIVAALTVPLAFEDILESGNVDISLRANSYQSHFGICCGGLINVITLLRL